MFECKFESCVPVLYFMCYAVGNPLGKLSHVYEKSGDRGYLHFP